MYLVAETNSAAHSVTVEINYSFRKKLTVVGRKPRIAALSIHCENNTVNTVKITLLIGAVFSCTKHVEFHTTVTVTEAFVVRLMAHCIYSLTLRSTMVQAIQKHCVVDKKLSYRRDSACRRSLRRSSHSRSLMLVPIESPYATSLVTKTNLHYRCQISRSIEQIIAFDRRGVHLSNEFVLRNL